MGERRAIVFRVRLSDVEFGKLQANAVKYHNGNLSNYARFALTIDHQEATYVESTYQVVRKLAADLQELGHKIDELNNKYGKP